MPSLQAKHQRSCKGGRAWTTFATALTDCSCAGGPTDYINVRLGSSSSKIRVGRNRCEAERALQKVGVAVDE